MISIAYADLDQPGPTWWVHGAWGGGAPLCTLWTQVYRWRCADTDLHMRVVAGAPQEVLASEPTEPLAGAIARLTAHHAFPESVCCLLDPGVALAEDRLRWAWGLRAMGLGREADETIWDQAWLSGIAAYGLCGRLRLTLHGKVDAQSVLLALGYGHVLACAGDVVERWEETSRGLSWRLRTPGEVAILGGGGFELARLGGLEGTWCDHGDEGLVRAVVSAGGARCWSQPRLVRTVPGGSCQQ